MSEFSIICWRGTGLIIEAILFVVGVFITFPFAYVMGPDIFIEYQSRIWRFSEQLKERCEEIEKEMEKFNG